MRLFCSRAILCKHIISLYSRNGTKYKDNKWCRLNHYRNSIFSKKVGFILQFWNMSNICIEYFFNLKDPHMLWGNGILQGIFVHLSHKTCIYIMARSLFKKTMERNIEHFRWELKFIITEWATSARLLWCSAKSRCPA